MPKNKLFLRANCKPFTSKSIQIWDHFLSLLFPKDSESLKTLEIRLWEVGAKRRLNFTLKVNKQTDRQTDGHRDGHFDLDLMYLTELTDINHRVKQWYERESEKYNILSRTKDINLIKKDRIHYHGPVFSEYFFICE